MNKFFINKTQQIRRDSSWNPNQIGSVTHGNHHHYKTIKKKRKVSYRKQEEDGDPLP